MNKRRGALVCLAFLIGGTISSAQNSAVPFRQIERDAQVSAGAMSPTAKSAVNRLYIPSPVATPASGLSIRPPYRPPRTIDAKFFLVNGLNIGLSALDIGLTQHCIASHSCREGNPFMPSSLAGQIGVNSALIGSGLYVSYRLKRQQSKAWWVSPVAGIATHTAGAITGFINR